MWTHSWAISLAVAATLIGELTTAAQVRRWETVDDFALGDGNASARGVAVDAAGRVYAVGNANGHGIVRYSGDGGANWITCDDFVYPSETNNLFNAVTVDAGGDVFVGGSSGLYPNEHWIVRRSADHGITWETVDDYWQPWHAPEEPGTNGVVYSLSNDGHGRVYAAGPLIRTHCPCYNTWWVRGSSIGGTNWDTKLALPSGYGEILQTTCAGEDVYATGWTDGFEFAIGLILRSSDHGATWASVFEGKTDLHRAITADSAGNLYSAGYSWDSTSIVWLVREATPGGTNWTTLDSFTNEPWFGGLPRPDGHYPVPMSIAVDAEGDICVTGGLIQYQVSSGSNGTSYSTTETWFVRQYSVDTDQWSTSDLSFSTNTYGAATGTAFAPDGSTFVVGCGSGGGGQQRWLVRRSSVPGHRVRPHDEHGPHGGQH